MEVKVIQRRGQMALVEWVDQAMLKRGFVPVDEVRNDIVKKTVLNRAAPYGVPWEEIVKLDATPEMLAQNLRQRGIWTVEDLYAQPDAAQGALLKTYGVDYHTLLKLSQEVK
jgi:mannose/fructose/N-acetylgalactosamine-specific phosphotransferase system component IIB